MKQVFYPQLLIIHNMIYEYLYKEPTGSPTVTIKFVTPEIIHLCWTAPSEEEQNGVITGYLVEYMTNRRNGSEIISVNETEYVLESLPHTIYQIGVAALNSAGQGPLSDFTTITTPQDGIMSYMYQFIFMYSIFTQLPHMSHCP